jgi:branched-chain amino acid transport system ATP-binding protein
MNAAAIGSGLVLKDLRAGYGETVVLKGVSLALQPAGSVAVLGRNGVGKTTLLATMMGHTRLHGGSIGFRGRDIGALPIYQRAALGLALVPQEREIFRSLTVEENLLVAAREGRWTLPRVYDFFPALAARRTNRGDRLSGGEQQMLAIGRALIGNPSYLLLDEPLEGLAPIIVDQLLSGLERLKREQDLALMLVEQHAHLALQFADTAIVLDRGSIVYQGASRELASDPGRMSVLLGVARSNGG